MQLTNSSTPTDPALLALLFPGAIPTPPGADGQSLSPGSDLPANASPVFADVFAELVPAGAMTAAQSPAAVSEFPATSPVVGAPPTRHGICLVATSSPRAAVQPNTCSMPPCGAASEAAEADSADEPAATGKSSAARPTKPSQGKGVQVAPARATEGATASHPAEVANFAAVNRTPPADERITESHEPDEHASEVAFATPRFAALPAVALEHRATTKLPPGIERRATDREAAPTEPDLPEPESGMTMTPPDARELLVAQPQLQPLTSPNSGDEQVHGRPTTWRGAAAEHQARDFPMPDGGHAGESDRELPVRRGELIDASAGLQRRAQSGVFSTAIAAARSVPADPTETLPRADSVNVPDATAGAVPSTPHTLRPATPMKPIEVADTASDDTGSELDSSAVPPLPVRAAGSELPMTATAVGLRFDPAAARRENFSLVATNAAEGENRPEPAAAKSFVAAEEQEVAPKVKPLGIAVAKAVPTMFARFLPAPVQHPASEYASAPASTASSVLDPVAPADPALPHAVSRAHEAVEVVLHTIEQAAATQHKAVNLQFSVGDADLSVRVEVHAGEVRTTFRTDSADLRAALAHEWQSVSASLPGDRTVRLVPALFTAGEQSALNSFGGDTPSRQRHPGAQAESREQSMTAALRVRSRSVMSTPHAGSAAINPASVTSRRLHTTA